MAREGYEVMRGVFHGSPEHRAARRGQIVFAARQLATQSGTSVQLRKVADAAGVTTSTVYQHFHSKNELLVTCFLEWLAERRPDNFVSTAPDTEFGSSLTAFVQGLTVSLIETPRLATFAARAYFADDHPAGVSTDLIRSTLGAMFANKINMDGTLLDRLAIGELVADVWAASLLALVQNRISLPKALIRVGGAITLIEKHASLSSPLGE